MKSQNEINVIIIDSQSVVWENTGAGESCVQATLKCIYTPSVGRPLRMQNTLIDHWISENECANFCATPTWADPDTWIWYGVWRVGSSLHSKNWNRFLGNHGAQTNRQAAAMAWLSIDLIFTKCTIHRINANETHTHAHTYTHPEQPRHAVTFETHIFLILFSLRSILNTILDFSRALAWVRDAHT